MACRTIEVQVLNREKLEVTVQSGIQNKSFYAAAKQQHTQIGSPDGYPVVLPGATGHRVPSGLMLWDLLSHVDVFAFKACASVLSSRSALSRAFKGISF